MSDPYAGITPAFGAKLKSLLAACTQANVTMRPYFGLRDPVTQGRLWRQSRDTSLIVAEIAKLKAIGAPFLAHCLDKAGPANGTWATNAVPGNSWHQFGEAMDCVWMRNGAECWSESLDGDNNGYQIYMRKASTYGLTAIGLTMGKDFGHVQLRPQGAPDDLWGWSQIDTMMKSKFPNL